MRLRHRPQPLVTGLAGLCLLATSALAQPNGVFEAKRVEE